MEKYKKFLFNLIFNIAETLIIILAGIQLKINIKYLLLILLTFIISRACFGKPLHFKTWYRCLIWSLALLLTLFVILKVDLTLSILFTIFNALIMTGKTNISDIYLWNPKGTPSKYSDIDEYIKYNEFNDKLIEFEKKLKSKSDLEYLIYKYRFIDHKTFEDMFKLLDLENPRLVEHLDKIAFAIRLYCGI